MNYSELSHRLSRALDSFGYGTQQRHFRREAYRLDDIIINEELSQMKQVTVGSKGEGLTNCYESDKDMLVIDTNVLCTERVHEGRASRNQTVLTCTPDISYHGHMLLQLASVGSIVSGSIMTSFRAFGGKLYLSSADFSKTNVGCIRQAQSIIEGFQVNGIVGPSVSISWSGIDSDYVFVLPCFCPSLLHSWASRPRLHGWPSSELIDQVVRMGAVAAPTAHAGSLCKELEWRICFNLGETLLVSSLNDTLCKLYVLLKMVKKDILKPKNKEITSYLLKNIVFWMAEFNPQEVFTDDTLYYWLVKALEFLKQAIKQNNIPYYMLPARNLLAGKILPDLREQMLNKLEQVLDAGPNMLLMCGKINRALTSVRLKRLDALGCRRNRLEMLFLIAFRNRWIAEHGADENAVMDEILIPCFSESMDIVLPEWKQWVFLEEPLKGNASYQLIKTLWDITTERMKLLLV